MRGSVQALHRFNVWVAHYGDAKKVIVGELVEEKAVQLASSVVTEAFIYTVRTTSNPPPPNGVSTGHAPWSPPTAPPALSSCARGARLSYTLAEGLRSAHEHGVKHGSGHCKVI